MRREMENVGLSLKQETGQIGKLNPNVYLQLNVLSKLCDARANLHNLFFDRQGR